MRWRRGELCAIMSSGSVVVRRSKQVGLKVALAGCEVSDGITGALYSHSTCVEVGSSLEGRLAQRRSLVPEA